MAKNSQKSPLFEGFFFDKNGKNARKYKKVQKCTSKMYFHKSLIFKELRPKSTKSTKKNNFEKFFHFLFRSFFCIYFCTFCTFLCNLLIFSKLESTKKKSAFLIFVLFVLSFP